MKIEKESQLTRALNDAEICEVSREGCTLHCTLLYSNWLYFREGVKDVSGKVVTGEEETATWAS